MSYEFEQNIINTIDWFIDNYQLTVTTPEQQLWKEVYIATLKMQDGNEYFAGKAADKAVALFVAAFRSDAK